MVEPLLDVNEIQGNSLRGFDTPYIALLGFKIDDASVARGWLSSLSYRVDTLGSVHHYRITRSFAPIRAPRTLLNIAISARALREIGFDLAAVEDGFFLQPMGWNAAALGDRVDGSGAPPDYVVGSTWDDTPDILLIIGADSVDSLVQFSESMRTAAAMAGCTTIYKEERGNKLPGEIEHFGFRDGISQVGVRGRLSSIVDDYLTLRRLDPNDPSAGEFAKPGQPLVWPGQFVFGYPTQLPGTSLEPGPDSDGGPPWMKNGSFLVYRRLRQDVPAFHTFLQEQATLLTGALGRAMTEHEVGALIVGRWRDGSPLLLSPNQPNQNVSGDEMLVNDFAFAQGTPSMTLIDPPSGRMLPPQAGDPAGQRCPFFAHIRKVNPRDLTTDQGIAGRTLTFQMLRRGVPYGPRLAGSTPDGADRGLLFLAYQTSFKRQFNVLNTLWVNNSSAPEMTDEGFDLLISQNSGRDRAAALRDSNGTVKATMNARTNWVIPTGGGFFFSPSVSFLRSLR